VSTDLRLANILDLPPATKKKAPPSGPFPLWSDVAKFHDGLVCHVHGARYYPNVYGGFVRIFVAAWNCTDMSGAIDAALADGREVKLIEVFAGNKPDTLYMRDAEGEWQAGPSRPSQPIDDEGEALQLPPTRAPQTRADDLPKMPFDLRPGTTRAQARDIATVAVNAAIDRKAEPARKARDAAAKKLKAIEAARADAVAELDAIIMGRGK